MEKRWAASGGGAFEGAGAVAFVATTAGRFAVNKCHAPAAITMNKAAIPAASRATAERFLGREGLRLGGDADLQGIHPDRFGDVLELRRAEIGDGEIEAPFDLTIGVLGETDRARLANAFETRGDVDAVTHQIAVAFLDNVTQMNADPKLNSALRRQAGVAFGQAVLHFDGAAHGVDHAAELGEAAVAGSLENASIVQGDGRIDQIAAERPEPGQRAIFVRAGEAAVADYIRDQDRRDFPGCRHGASSNDIQNSTMTGPTCPMRGNQGDPRRSLRIPL